MQLQAVPPPTLAPTYPPPPPLAHHMSLTVAQVVNPSVVATSSLPDGSGGSVTLTTLKASILTGQQLRRATFALARVGSAASPWRLLTSDFAPEAPDPLRLPVNALPLQVL